MENLSKFVNNQYIKYIGIGLGFLFVALVMAIAFVGAFTWY